MKPPEEVCLWYFPRAEFDAWRRARCGDSPTYDDYIARLRAAALEIMARGTHVHLVRASVAQMLTALEKEGLENTSANRARAICRLAYHAGEILGGGETAVADDDEFRHHLGDILDAGPPEGKP